MAGGDRRGSLAPSSSGSGSGRWKPEHERWPRSPAWSRPLSDSGRPSPQKQFLLLLVLEVPVPFHRGVVQLALHRVVVIVRVRVHEAEEQGRRAGG